MEPNIETRVKAIIIDILFVDESEVIPDARIRNDLGADSIDLVELILKLEKEFGLSISDKDADTLKTVNDFYIYIKARV